MRLKKLIVLALCVILLSGCSWSWLFLRVRIDITNDSNDQIDAVYARGPNTEDWGQNLLGDPLAEGATESIFLYKDVYDIKVSSSAGDSSIFESIDLQNTEIYAFVVGKEAL